jgi:hypothetical protein
MSYIEDQLNQERAAHRKTQSRLLEVEAENTKLRQQLGERNAAMSLLGQAQHELSIEKVQHANTSGQLRDERARSDMLDRAIKQYKARFPDAFTTSEKVVVAGPKA